MRGCGRRPLHPYFRLSQVEPSPSWEFAIESWSAKSKSKSPWLKCEDRRFETRGQDICKQDGRESMYLRYIFCGAIGGRHVFSVRLRLPYLFVLAKQFRMLDIRFGSCSNVSYLRYDLKDSSDQ